MTSLQLFVVHLTWLTLLIVQDSVQDEIQTTCMKSVLHAPDVPSCADAAADGNFLVCDVRDTDDAQAFICRDSCKVDQV